MKKIYFCVRHKIFIFNQLFIISRITDRIHRMSQSLKYTIPPSDSYFFGKPNRLTNPVYNLFGWQIISCDLNDILNDTFIYYVCQMPTRIIALKKYT